MPSADSSDSCFHFHLSWAAGVEGEGSISSGPAVEAPNVDIGQELCKQAWPERFNTDPRCFNEGLDLILIDCPLIAQDEGPADAGELRGGGCGADKYCQARALC